MPLHNHLRDSLATQGLAAHEFLLRDGGQSIEYCRDEEEHGRSEQTRRSADKTDPLDSAEDHVDGGAHRVGGEAADKLVELGGGGTDSEEEGNLYEEDHEGRGTGAKLALA